MAGKYKKIVIVTGGSSGIGRCTASALRDSGCIVYEFSRRNIPMEGITHLSVDVTDENAVNSAVKQIIQKETKIDAVINCAGFGISGAVEFTSTDQAKTQFNVNFFGTVNVNKAVLPFMHHQGNGHIINISSVAAVAHIPFQTFYSASKAAISSYSYALENEVKPYSFADQNDEEPLSLDFPLVFILFIPSTVLFGSPTAHISFVLLLLIAQHTLSQHFNRENIGSLQLTYNPCIA